MDSFNNINQSVLEITIQRSERDGLLEYILPSGKSYHLPVFQDNIFKITERFQSIKNFSGYQIEQIKTTDGIPTFRLVSASQRFAYGGGGKTVRCTTICCGGVSNAVILLGVGTGSSYRCGQANVSGGACSTVSGGSVNIANGPYSTISGGINNTASNYGSTISGGYGNTASGYQSFIGGGLLNTSSAYRSTVGGGLCNLASGDQAFIGGGVCNLASLPGATISGGYNNIANAACAVVGGGSFNTSSGGNSFIGGGSGNTASGLNSAILGGINNSTSGYAETMIVGSSIVANRANTTFMNKLSVTQLDVCTSLPPQYGFYYDTATCVVMYVP